MPNHRVAFIGCGGRGKDHAHGACLEPRAEIVAVCDLREEAARSLAEACAWDAPVYTNHLEMLEAVKPEVAVVSLWTPLHLPILRDCIAAGVKAVMSEKPMAPTWGECQEMSQLAEEAGVQLTFCHQRRFCPGNRRVRQWIADGAFGTIERLDLFAPPNLLDCGTHTFDQALSFLGEPKVKWVLGAVERRESLNWFGVPSEAVAAGLIVFETGVRATFQIGGPDMDIWGGVRVTGSQGFIEVFWDGDIRRAVRYDDPAWQPAPLEPRIEHFEMGQVFRDAFDCLETGQPSELSHHRALAAAEIIFGIYESVRRRERVEFPVSGFTDNPFITMLLSGTL